MKINLNKAVFETTAVNAKGYPPKDIPQIAFVGRSNVGKSSAINFLLRRKNLARVGSVPGKTRGINFYNVDETLYFVDLPGYGYASVGKGEQASWRIMINEYLEKSPELKLIAMIVDIRHEPSPLDKTMHDWILSRGLPYLVIATKADKLKKREMNKNLMEIRKGLAMKDNIPLLLFSPRDKVGFDGVWKNIYEILEI